MPLLALPRPDDDGSPAEAGPWGGNGSVPAGWSLAEELTEDFRRLAELAREGIVVHRRGRVVYANQAALQAFDVPPGSDVAGRPLSDFIDPEGWDPVARLLREGYGDPAPRTVRIDGVPLAGGGPVDLEIASVTIPWQGEPARCSVFRDISRRRRAERALRDRETQLALAIEGTGGALWDAQLIPAEGGSEIGPVLISPEMKALAGYRDDELGSSWEAWRGIVVAADLPAVEAALDGHLAGRMTQIDVEHRVRHRAGGVRWIHCLGRLLTDDGGRPVRTAGIAWDVTERKEAELALARRTRELGERVKELRGLFAVSNALHHAGERLEDTFQEIVEILPASWQYPEITCSRLEIEGREHLSPAFRATPWCQEAEIRLDGRKVGRLQICYLEERPEEDDGPFLAEETALLAAVVEHIAETLRRRTAEEELRRSEEKFAKLFHASPVAMTLTGFEDGRVLEANESFLAVVGRSRDEVIGATAAELDIAEGHWREVAQQLAERGRAEGVEIELRSTSGELRHLVHYAERLEIGGRACVLSVGHDVTGQKVFEARLRHLAFHDALTGLPNRSLFVDRLDQAVRRARRYRTTLAVLHLDLDGFKVVNDALGYGAGDLVLKEVARRLTESLRSHDTVARLGGDEFGALLEDLAGPREASAIAERVEAALGQPFRVGATPVYPRASIGLACSSDGGDRPRDLLRFADVAMHRAKGQAVRRHVFDRAVDVAATDRLHRENALRRAIGEGQLTLHYQPVVSLADDRVVGVEALVRWHHPRRGLVLPGEFIPLAEESGLIGRLGDWVLREALRQGAAWNAGPPAGEGLTVSVNVSARQLLDPAYPDRVRRLLEEACLEPDRLLLELTENALVQAPERAWELRELGIRLAIDDFGTGYASLAYLKKLPVSVLKVDQSFTRGLGRDRSDATLVRTILFMARNLGLGVVVEGVETAAQAGYLRRVRCPLAQGFHFARPAPAGEVEPFLRREVLPGGRREGSLVARPRPARSERDSPTAMSDQI